ncbi:aminoglycoside phosphotransferase family protein [Paenibacillus thailandensis]|uniref:Aminoglycoside phosphotransferase family protein n=1 Tax=Paenibacillus thailandensis TaxID=393250 RepID=A0ABW5QSL8_9BACL
MERPAEGWDKRICGRELLYRGLNGRNVERVWLASGESFILKPLPADDSINREAWVYEHVLPMFPPVFPRLAASSSVSGMPGRGWLLFEDMGELNHSFSEETAVLLAAAVAEWHSLPVSRWADAPLSGPKPGIEAMAAELMEDGRKPSPDGSAGGPGERDAAEVIRALARRLNLHEIEVESVLKLWEQEKPSPETVMCHGDLHLGNYAVKDGRLIVLDWEHAHPNYPYWDLYHLIDLSHPVFPKTVTASVRERVLDVYVERRGLRGFPSDPGTFKRGYALFASIFSLWMLRLIAADLESGGDVPWTPDQLKRQRTETEAALEACLSMLNLR